MPDLIIMPKTRHLLCHTHSNDHQISGAMSLQTPSMTNEVFDFSQDLGEIMGIWGDQLHGYTIGNPRAAFWSLNDIQEWVRENARADVYANQTYGMSLYVCSTDKSTVDTLAERSRVSKNHRIETRMDALLSDEVGRWIQDNCVDKIDVDLGWPKDGGRVYTYSFRSLDDLTMFTVRWKGHDALEIL